MLGRLFLLLTLVPMVELFVLLWVHGAVSERYGWRVGLAVSVGAIVVTGVVGALLARRQGIAAVRELRATLERGEFPGRPLLDAAMIVVGGALLLTPGFLTDTLGLTLLFPPSRTAYRRIVERWIRGKIAQGEAQFQMRTGPAGRPTSAPDQVQPGEVVIEGSFATATEEPDDQDAGRDDQPTR